MNGHDVRVAEKGKRLGLAAEPFGERGFRADLGRKDLYSNEPVELLLAGLINRSHAPDA